MQIGEAMRHMSAERQSRADASSPLRVIGIVDEGQYISSGSSSSASGLQLLKEAVQNHGSTWTMTAATAASIAQISELVLQLPCLQVLELTHHPHVVVEGVKAALHDSAPGEVPCWFFVCDLLEHLP